MRFRLPSTVANYGAKEILQACVRLDIKLSHAPVRDGAAKGKIERFFRGASIRHVNNVLIQPHWRSHEELIAQQVQASGNAP